MSRKSQVVGAAFEDWINGQHKIARMQGILAHVDKTQAKTSHIKGHLTYVGKGVADYTGTLEGGLSLAEEAKSIQVRLFYKKDIDTKQADHLDRVARAGGLALFVVEFRQTEAPFFQRFAVPWLQVPWSVQISAETVAADDLKEWLIAPETCYLSRFHKGGRSTSPPKMRGYARE